MEHTGELGSHQGLLAEMPSARQEGEWVMKQIPLASFRVSAADQQQQRASETAGLLQPLCRDPASLVRQPSQG